MTHRRESLRRLSIAIVFSVIAAAAAVKANPLGLQARALDMSRPFAAQTAVGSPLDVPDPFASAAPAALDAPAGTASSPAEEAGCGLPLQRSCSPCGGPGQRACTVTERIPSCNAGLVEIAGCSGDCTGPIFDSSGTCVALSPCGGEGQRACTITERVPSCNAGLGEIAGCTGDCRGPVFNSSGMCTAVSACGGKGQRACTIGERIPSCNAGLVEIPGCSGNCFGAAGDTSIGMCTVVENIPEPDINGSNFSVGTCSLDGYMDMHMHQFAHMAHGGGVLAGTPYDAAGGVNKALEGDFSTSLDLVNGDGTELGSWSDGVSFAQTTGLIAFWLGDIQFQVGNLMQMLIPCDRALWGGRCDDDYLHGWHDPLLGDSVGSFIGTKDGAGFSNMGAPLFNGWPKWTSTTHQQVYFKWLERAWRGGLRMMTELAVTNEALCRGSKHIKGTQCREDALRTGGSMTSIDAQIDAAKAFEKFIDRQDDGQENGTGWYRIVTTPFQARSVIAQGKLAVNLGIETAELFNCYELGNCTQAQVEAEVDKYYNKGVRVVFPIHNFDNAFGAAATWQDGIEVGQKLVEGNWWQTQDCGPQGYGFKLGGFTQGLITLLKFSNFINIATYPDHNEDATCNARGMRPLGEFLMQKLMAKGMIIDVDHMSIHSFNRALDLAENFSRNGVTKYPGIVASHVLSFDLHEKEIDGEGTRHERLRTSAQLQRIKNVGGMVAAMLKDDAQDTGNKGKKLTKAYTPENGGTIADNCRHSSKTFAHAFQYLVDQMDGAVALGSDFNGVAGHVGPRFGVEACGFGGPGTIDERNAQLRDNNRVPYPFTLPGFGTFQRQVTGHRTFDYNYDGMAHVGLLPDFVQDLKQVGMNDFYMDKLFGGAEAYIRMWEKTTKSTPETTDDTPQGAIDNTCTYLADPELSVTGPAQVNEDATADFTVVVNKGFDVNSACQPFAFVSSHTRTLLDASDPLVDRYRVSCRWTGGPWPGAQVGTVGVTASRPGAGSVTRDTSINVVNVAPTLSGLTNGSATTGVTTVSRTLTFGDAPFEQLRADINWGDGRGTQTNVMVPIGNHTISHVYIAPGTYTATVTVRDEGLSTTRTATFTVTGPPDSVPPTLTVPDDIVVPQDTLQGTVVDFEATATDNGSPVPVTCNPASGSMFPVTVTTVTCFAVDHTGNKASDSFTVTVTPGGRVSVYVPSYGNPRSRWRFDEVTGTRLQDTSQFWWMTRDGTIGNGTNRVSNESPGQDVHGNPHPAWAVCDADTNPQTQPDTQWALMFGNGNDDTNSFANLGEDAGRFGTGDFTISLWLQLFGSGNNTTLLTNGTNVLKGQTQARLSLKILQGRPELWLERGDGQTVQLMSNVPVTQFPPQRFFNVVVRRKGNKVSLSVNNTTVSATMSGVWDIRQDVNAGDSTALFMGGVRANGTNTIASNAFWGRISDVQHFERELTDPEVATIYASRTDQNGNGQCDGVSPDVFTTATSGNGGAATFDARAIDVLNRQARPHSCIRHDNGQAAISGASYPIGTTKVTCSSTELSGTAVSQSFNIVMDAGDFPWITVPDDISRTANRVDGRIVTFTATAKDKQDGNLTPACVPASGSVFGVGTTTVTCSVKDSAGNSASDHFNVLVVDLPPVLFDPPDRVVEATGPNGATVTWVPMLMTDEVDGNQPQTCLPGPGSVFPLGSSVVTCTGADSRGQAGVPTSFNVLVRDTIAPVVEPATTPSPNAAGWHNAATSVAWTTTDAVGVTTTFGCQAQTISFDTNGVTLNCFAFDAAGNLGIGNTQIRLDATPPMVTFQAPQPAANANGWRNMDTYITYVASDSLSGLVAGTTTNAALQFFTDGENLTQSVTVTDIAGNTRTATTVPINLDKTAPAITPSRAPSANAAGWNNTDVNVSFTCSDALSGLVSCAPPQAFTAEGVNQQASGIATDLAGNVATATVTGINIDKTAPTAVGERLTPPNANGWNNTLVQVLFTSEDALSGVEVDNLLVAVPGQGANQSRSHTFTDRAGNSASATVGGINVDRTPPTITGARAPLANAHGWNNTDVTVSFTCEDSVSGIAACDGNDVVTAAGANQSRSGTAVDLAGNQATVTVPDISIDRTPPTLALPSPFTVPALTAGGATVTFMSSSDDDLSGSLGHTCAPASGSPFAMGVTTVQCQVSDKAGNITSAGFAVTVADQAPPVVVAADVTFEATGPDGALATFSASASDGIDGTVAVSCNRASGVKYPLGATLVTCTATDAAGNTGTGTLSVNIVDTRPPVVSGQNLTLVSPSPAGLPVALQVTATDIVSGQVPVTCTPATGAVFPIGQTPVSCSATDGAGNVGTGMVTVTVIQSASACFTVDFREITYFNNSRVITSSDADIRARNGISGPFDPSLWPYSSNGKGQTTKSRGTLFRLYGFKPDQLGKVTYNADNPAITYVVQRDSSIQGGAYYVDLGGPARVTVCPSQLHDYVLAGEKGNGHKNSSNLLPEAQRNVPGLMLTHNSQILKVPSRIRRDLREAGLPASERGLIDYIGVQLQGNGNAQFREFVDVEVSFPWDSDTDLEQHFKFGFHTATNTNFETFAGCNYIDSAPGNDSVRLTDLWSPNGSSSGRGGAWQACGDREPRKNQRTRADYEVPYNAVQLLPTVNSNTDTLRLFYGPIQPVPEKEWTKKGHKHDWRDWDDDDDRYERERRGRTDNRRDERRDDRDDKGRKR